MPNASPISAVVFDIGRVLLEWEPERFYEERLGAPRSKAFFAEVPIHEANLNVDRGHPFKETIYALADLHPEWAEDIRHWHDSWLKLAYAEIPHSARLLRALRAKGVPVYALTNFGKETFDIAQAHYPVLNEFDRVFVSGHLRCIKPDAEIYTHLETAVPQAPHQLIFADDRPENIEAARQRGWHTHLFTTPQGWADRLVAERLLTKDEAQ